jgi:hypothetical protein
LPHKIYLAPAAIFKATNMNGALQLSLLSFAGINCHAIAIGSNKLIAKDYCYGKASL